MTRLLVVRSCTGLLLLLALPAAAAAQVAERDIELASSASLSWLERRTEGQEDQGQWGGAAFIDAGYFLTDSFQLGGQVGVSYTDLEGDAWFYSIFLGPEASFHFRTSTRIVPFAGAGAGGILQKSERETALGPTVDGKTTGWSAFARAGADFFITRDVSIQLQLIYRHEEVEDERESVVSTPSGIFKPVTELERETDFIQVTVGLAFFLRRGAKAHADSSPGRAASGAEEAPPAF